MGSVNPLMGRSVLIVEDEPLHSTRTLHRVLDSVGASIVAASAIKGALALRLREMRDGGSV